MGLLYEHVRRDSQKPKRPSNWGAYLNALKEAHVPRHVTDLLDGIRQNYRNPIVHPDAILTTDQAIVLGAALFRRPSREGMGLPRAAWQELLDPSEAG